MIPLLFACARCEPTSWDDVPITTMVDEPELMERVTLSLDEFIRWSGRDESCVTGVFIEESLGETAEAVLSGTFNTRNGELQISAEAYTVYNMDPWSTLTHELCHAIDHEEVIAAANPALFPAEDVPEHYPRRQ